MSSKLTQRTESSPSVLPPSVLNGSDILSQFSSPSMASSGHFDPIQVYDGYKAVEVLDPACTECLAKGKIVLNSTIPDLQNATTALLGRSRATILGSKLPMSGDAEGSDELDGEGAEVIPHSAGHPSNSSPSQPPAKRFQSQVIPSTPRNFQPTLATITTSIPPASTHSSHTRPALNPAVRSSPIQQSRNSPIVNSQQLQPVASTSRRREELSTFLFPAAQVLQHRDQWPI
ncbi:hypothetical protein O181_104336 [Austropuccinia psidii MF-1]|uniref:Uncharacterized protein n=1 Tax=Austropuccinia psidii MF-1 TaxID=1389203 RepID=A0A9Q3PLA6_9BASI|nr:hypothetical protein [Austropuccinia psidii MF-1]